MPTIHNWEEWDDIEEQTNDELSREKINQKPKTHDKKEWVKLDERLQKENGKKIINKKRRTAHKTHNHHIK
jgi:hypothetical protein|tara:strand:+ start:761 stop:973 length:213 start_codon:yes stop_codon:yes gene_type:complete